MRQMNASEDRIAQMRQAFRGEMVHRVSWILAKYMDTPNKLEAGITSAVAAPHRLHGGKYDLEAVDEIIACFVQLREKAAAENPEYLVDGGGLCLPNYGPPENPASPETDSAMLSVNLGENRQRPRPDYGHVAVPHSPSIAPEDVVMVESYQSRHNGSSGNDGREYYLTNESPPEPEHQVEFEDDELVLSSTETLAAKTEAKKYVVSRPMRWNIRRQYFTAGDTPQHFKRKIDLLPIMKRELDLQRRRK
ncbi:hypothetical protein BCR34DRAFT_374818 [Clohesyomyces aquaticus]|uniref:Uncharacterized protein n=1 Tax=Clohesyomyces aquaticus TaxID=1231657 RepID=A0A1Y1ZGE0_9PLEO|nr:hypothetical protein BCR34DRAFT_374818 [Clohesyomyces aquaticus]